MTPDEAFDEVDGAGLEAVASDIGSDIGLPRIKDELLVRERPACVSPLPELPEEPEEPKASLLRVKSEREDGLWEHTPKKRQKLQVTSLWANLSAFLH